MPRRPHIHPCHITHNTLVELITYDIYTGQFTIPPHSERCYFNTRQTHIHIDKHVYPLDRLAMFYLTGTYDTEYAPVHIDGDKHNNAASNLRPHSHVTTAKYRAKLEASKEAERRAQEHALLTTAIEADAKELRALKRKYMHRVTKLRAAIKNNKRTLRRWQRSSDDSFH